MSKFEITCACLNPDIHVNGNRYVPEPPPVQIGDFVRVLASQGGHVPVGWYGKVIPSPAGRSPMLRQFRVEFAKPLVDTPYPHTYYFHVDELGRVS